ncbi:MAG: hypothetical protein P8046_11300 [Anaerolineales bacterium]
MEILLIKSFTDKPWRSPSTFQQIETSLKEKWVVHTIHTTNPALLINKIKTLQTELKDNLFVFNIAEYLDEENKSGFIPALLDDINVLHLGSSAKTARLGLNKVETKNLLLEEEVPTPRFFVIRDEGDLQKSQINQIGFPLIIKPVFEGGHIGIHDDSIVHDMDSAQQISHRILNDLHQPALVEEYIGGANMREFSVGILDGVPRLFTPIEIDFNAMDNDRQILSYEAAQDDLEEIKLVPQGELLDLIIHRAAHTFDIVGGADYGRVDLRMDDAECYVLEINMMPGLGPTSFLPQAAKDIHSMAYPQLIQKLVQHSMDRQKIKNKH